MNLSLILRDARLKANLTQNDVANLLGYDNGQFISAWERGIAQPPMSYVPKLSKIYKISEKELTQLLLDQHHVNLDKRFYRKAIK